MFAIIDIETTGLDPKKDKITEIAILIHDGMSVIEHYSSLVNPQRNIPSHITRVTGITNEMVKDAPKFYQIANIINDLTRDKVFVAHNVAFDYGFVAEEFKSFGYNFKREKLCTVRLSKKLLPRRASYSLGRLCQSLGIELVNHHRAAADAAATAKLFDHLLYLKNNDSRYKSHDLQAINTGRLEKIQQYILAKLPESTGVYYFLNREEEIVYIGKSKNIRQRAIQHFNSDELKIKKLLSETYNVRFEETGSELIALLLESEEIKKYKPRYNRSLRKDAFSYTMEVYDNEKGIKSIRILKKEESSNPILYFHTWLSARTRLNDWIDKYGICPKYCGLYDEAGPCFNHQIKKCAGICCDKESIELYNEKVNQAIQNFIPETNFLVIEELGRSAFEKSFVLVKNNKYAGYGYVHIDYTLDKEEECLKRVVPYNYYPDMDDLIRMYLKKKKNLID